LEGIFLLFDEADKIKLDSALGMLQLPISKDRATRYLASRMCLDVYATRDVNGKPVPKKKRPLFDFRAEVCHHLQVVSTAPNHDYTTVC
jgi:hypothetical protein